MTLLSFEFPRPDNDVVFESYCLVVFRRHLNIPHLQKYGVRGQTQHGVDLIGTAIGGARYGIQCKLRNASSVMTKAELLDEVEKVRALELKLDHYVVATTAGRNKELQNAALQLTEENGKNGLFSVVVFSWQDIEEIVKSNSDLYGILHPCTVQVNLTEPSKHSVRFLASGAEGSSAAEQLDPRHADIDDAVRHILDGEPEHALIVLERLRQRNWDQLSDRAKYRLLANQGTALFWLDKPHEAARAYIEALSYQPDDIKARALEVRAYILLDEVDRAYELAQALCKTAPHYPLAHSVRIHAAPPSMPLNELIESVPASVQSDSEVALSLAKRALESEQWDTAEKYARTALAAHPDWDHALETLALSILATEKKAAILEDGDRPRVANPQRINEAITLLKQIVTAKSKFLNKEIVARSWANIGLAERLLDHPVIANEGIEKAFELDPKNPDIACSYCEDLGIQNFEAVIPILEDLPNTARTPRVRLMLAAALSYRQVDGDLQRAAEVLNSRWDDLTIEPVYARNQYVAAFVLVLAKQRDVEGISQCLASLPADLISPLTRACLKASAAFEMDAKSDALALAQEGLSNIESATRDEKSRLAMIFVSLKHWTEAFGLLKSYVRSDRDDRDTELLLRAAEETGNDEFLLDFCATRRRNGIIDYQSIGHEFIALTKYNDYGGAAEVLQDYLRQNPNDSWAIVNRSLLGLESGRNELVESDSSRLPSVQSVDDGLGNRVVYILIKTGQHEIAAEYAYKLFRRFPESSEAHQALFASMFISDDREPQLIAPSVVSPGCAVTLSFANGEQESAIIEDDCDPPPNITRNEYGPNHSLSTSLMGKIVGDSVSFGQGNFARSGVIEAIDHKIVYRAREVAEKWQQHFPDQPFIAKHRIPQSDASERDPKKILGEAVYESLVSHAAHADAVLKYYENGLVPVSMIAKALSKKTIETVQGLVASRKRIKCSFGTLAEVFSARNLMGTNRNVVLEPTAFATLLMLDELDRIKDLPFRCVVTEGVRQEIRELVIGERRQGYFGVIDGQPFATTVTSEQKASHNLRVEKMLCIIKEECEVVSGLAIASLPRDDREILSKTLNPGTAESIAEAIKRGCLLWTDDLGLAEYVRCTYQVQRTWTNVVYLELAAAGIVSQDISHTVTARLLGLGYQSIGFSAGTVICALNMTEWKVDIEPTLTVLKQFGNGHIEAFPLFQVFIATFLEIWRHAPSEMTANKILKQLFEYLTVRVDGRGMIVGLHRHIGSLMGIDVVRAQRVRATIRTWVQDFDVRSTLIPSV